MDNSFWLLFFEVASLMGSIRAELVINNTPSNSLKPKDSFAQRAAVMVPILISVINNIATIPGLKIEAPHITAIEGGIISITANGMNHGRTLKINSIDGIECVDSNGSIVRHNAAMLPQKKYTREKSRP